jgi:hypothetical protein
LATAKGAGAAAVRARTKAAKEQGLLAPIVAAPRFSEDTPIIVSSAAPTFDPLDILSGEGVIPNLPSPLQISSTTDASPSKLKTISLLDEDSPSSVAAVSDAQGLQLPPPQKSPRAL